MHVAPLLTGDAVAYVSRIRTFARRYHTHWAGRRCDTIDGVVASSLSKSMNNFANNQCTVFNVSDQEIKRAIAPCMRVSLDRT